MLCPMNKTCEKYKTECGEDSLLRWRCNHREYWSKCASIDIMQISGKYAVCLFLGLAKLYMEN